MQRSIAEEFKSLAMSANLGESLERAHRFAAEQSQRLVTLEHLLLSLTEDPEASLILNSANVDLNRLRAEVSGYLGHLMDDMRAEPGVEPRPDPELLRVLKAAASAAQQSRRRQIDGAIVLAAIVGDGKSPAAGQLKSLGMTFEEAIRALQRANTQARLKTAKSQPLGQPAGQSAPAIPSEALEAPSAPQHATPAANSGAGGLLSRLPLTSSADEILAAARARIQQRVAAAAARAEKAAEPRAAANAPAASSAGAMPPAAEDTREDRAGAQQPKATAENLNAPPTERAPTSGAEPTASAEPAAEERASAAAARSPQAARSAEPRLEPAGPSAPVSVPPRPQLQRTFAGLAARTGQPSRTAEEAKGRPHPPNGSAGAQSAPLTRPAHGPGQRAPTGTPARPAAPIRAAPGEARGPLIESIPRRMRLGRPASAEVRIARDKVNGLIRALHSRSGSGPTSDTFLARTLCVRLKAPSGGFVIEATSPETQWMEGAHSLVHDEFALWRWTVTPQRVGRGRLALLLSVRTVGPDGVIAESAPPDRIIEVRVRPNAAKRTLRLLGWSVALLTAGALGRFGEEVWSALLFLLNSTFSR
jgi:hypothetical protein